MNKNFLYILLAVLALGCSNSSNVDNISDNGRSVYKKEISNGENYTIPMRL